MARTVLSATETTSDAFYPQAQFIVVVSGNISGDIFVQIADTDVDLTVDSNWQNAHEESFDGATRQKVFVGSSGYAYRINADNAGPTVTWDYTYIGTANFNILD